MTEEMKTHYFWVIINNHTGNNNNIIKRFSVLRLVTQYKFRDNNQCKTSPNER